MIYKGNLNSLFIKDFQLTENGVNVALESSVVKRDVLFYKNFIGKMICFEYDTHLPSYYEAEAFVKGSVKEDGTGSSCLYADYDSIKPFPGETRSVKELKKEFKMQRKGRTNR